MGGPAVLVDDAVVTNLDDLRDRLGAEAAAALLAFDTTARDRMTPNRRRHPGAPDGLRSPWSRQRSDCSSRAPCSPHRSRSE
jgi:hypothetical protein